MSSTYKLYCLTDSIVKFVNDATKEGLLDNEEDEKKKAAAKEVQEGHKPFLETVKFYMLNNNNGEGFLVGSSPSWADFVVVCAWDRLTVMESTVLDNYQPFKKLQGRVHELKGIKEWLLKRPVTEN